jgi:hypothetical protein
MWLFTPIVQLYLLHLVVLTIASLWPGSGRPRRGECRCRPLADGRYTRLPSEISPGPASRVCGPLAHRPQSIDIRVGRRMSCAAFPVCQAPGKVAQTWHTPSAGNRGPGYPSF